MACKIQAPISGKFTSDIGRRNMDLGINSTNTGVTTQTVRHLRRDGSK